MSIYDNNARLQVAREHAEWLADEMRRSRRLTPDEAGLSSRLRLRELLHRVVLRRPLKEAEPRIRAYHA
jgi:hypothetical protein